MSRNDLGLLLGMATTTTIILTPAHGMKAMFKGFGFLEIVVWIWIYSSISEEIFVRGWYQSLASAGWQRVGAVEISSAVLFGAMHLSLIAKGADAMTVVIIVTFTTILGFVAARFTRWRRRPSQ